MSRHITKEERVRARIEKARRGDRYWYTRVPEGMGNFKAKVGDNFIRVMPAKNEDEDYAMDLNIHYNIGSDNSAFLCLERNDQDGKTSACPICEERRDLEKLGEDKEYIKKLFPDKRTLFCILDRDDERKGVQLYDAPKKTVGDVIDECCVIKKTNEFIDITSEKDGYDITIVRVGTSKTGTKYKSVIADRDSSEIDYDNWDKEIVSFDEVIVFESYDVIKQELLGVASTVEKEEDIDDSQYASKEQVQRETKEEELPARRSRGNGRDRKESQEDDEDIPEITPREDNARDRLKKRLRRNS